MLHDFGCRLPAKMAAIAAISFLASCATYTLPEGAPSATVIPKKAPGSTGTGVSIQYSDNSNFDNSLPLPNSDAGLFETTNLIEAEKRAYITSMGSWNGYYIWYCTSYFSFIPESGRTYFIYDEMRSGASGKGVRCRSYVVDSETGSIPNSFQVEDGPKR